MYTMCILWITHVPRKNAMETKPYESNTSYPIEKYCLDDQFILKKTKIVFKYQCAASANRINKQYTILSYIPFLNKSIDTINAITFSISSVPTLFSWT